MISDICQNPKLLVSWLTNELPSDQFAAVSLHLKSCSLCEQLVDDLLESDLSTIVTDDRAPVELRDRLLAVNPGEKLPEFPNYTIHRRLGQGSMGSVFLATQCSLGRQVAIKVIRSGLFATHEERTRFQREAQALAKVTHPHVVAVYDSSACDGQPFIAMEYVPGLSLAEEIQGRPLPPILAARLAQSLATAFEAIHTQGIVHRDLKPSNILLQPVLRPADGLVMPWLPKISDFGLAKDTQLTGSVTESEIGTANYMAPEQADGKPVTGTADIHALGAVLFEALVGHPPFRGKSRNETLSKVRMEPPRFPPKTNISRDLITICEKCLEKEPERRYPSALALAEDLQRFLGGHPIHARPVSHIGRLIRWYQRESTTAAYYLVIAVALLAVVIVGYRSIVPERELYLRKISAANQRCLDSNGWAAISLLDECPTHLRSWEWYYLRRLSENTQHESWPPMPEELDIAAQRPHRKVFERASIFASRVLKGHTASVSSITFAPDGQKLISGSIDNTTRVWDLNKDECLRTITHDEPVRAVAFSPDGKVIAIAHGPEVTIWDAALAKRIYALPTHKNNVNCVTFSPDGTLLMSGGIDSPVQIWDCRTREVRRVIPTDQEDVANQNISSLAFAPDGNRLAFVNRSWMSGTLTIRDAKTGKETIKLPPEGQFNTSCAAFSPDGTMLAAGSVYTYACISDASTGKPLMMLSTSPTCHVIGFTVDGKRVVTAGESGLIQIWDATSPREMLTLNRHTDAVHAMAFSPDGYLLATAGKDKVIRIWDARPLPAEKPPPK